MRATSRHTQELQDYLQDLHYWELVLLAGPSFLMAVAFSGANPALKLRICLLVEVSYRGILYRESPIGESSIYNRGFPYSPIGDSPIGESPIWDSHVRDSPIWHSPIWHSTSFPEWSDTGPY